MPSLGLAVLRRIWKRWRKIYPQRVIWAIPKFVLVPQMNAYTTPPKSFGHNRSLAAQNLQEIPQLSPHSPHGQPAITWVFQGRFARAFCLNASARHLRVRFCHHQKGRVDFDPIGTACAPTDKEFALLCVQTALNDYYLNPDLPDLRLALSAFCTRFERREASGYSMGGYGAVILSRALQLQKLLLVSPACGTFARQPPFDAILAAQKAVIMGEEGDPLAPPLPSVTGTILCDPAVSGGRDLAFARLIQGVMPHMQVLCLRFSGHPSIRLWDETGNFSAVQRAYHQGAISAIKLKQLQRRQRLLSPRYVVAMQKYLLDRCYRPTSPKQHGADGANLC